MMKKTLILFIALSMSAFLSAQVKEDGAQYNQYGVKVKTQELISEAQDGILVHRSKDNKYKLWLDMRVQADGAVFFGAPDYADKIGNGVSIRRARFAVKAQITPSWYGEVDMDMANGVFELKDAIIRYTGVEGLELQAGNFKEYFSIQRNNSSRYLQFMERPMITQALAPSRHLGINAKYSKDWFWGSTGVFFQTIDNLETRTYVEDANKDYGVDEGISSTTKVVLMPGYDKTDWGLHIAGAFSYRQPKTDDELVATGVPAVRFSTRNSNSINRKKYIDTDELKDVKHNLLYTGEFAGYWKGLRWEGAYLANDVVFSNTNPNMHLWGWYAQAGWLLFGGRQRYDSAGAKFTRPSRGQKWGDIELCARYEFIDFNNKFASNDVIFGAAQAFSLGLNYYVNDHFKVMINYQFNDNDRYANGKGNKLYVGKDASGKPTKDFTKVVAPTGKGGVDYSMLALRLELDF